jgi:hypothetical protein
LVFILFFSFLFLAFFNLLLFMRLQLLQQGSKSSQLGLLPFFILFFPQQQGLHLPQKDQINYAQPCDWHQQFAKEACLLLY